MTFLLLFHIERSDKLELNKIYNEDCLEGMKRIPDGSVDMILCDLPYGTTRNKWDTIIPFEPLWEQYERVIKAKGAIVLTASQPFTTKLISSNMNLFKYTWVWNKKRAGNFMLAKYQPMKIHEDIVVFSKEPHNYYPIKTPRKKIKVSKNYGFGDNFGNSKNDGLARSYTHRNPQSIIEVSNASQKGKVHPTQKPVALFEYLIKTYTNEGETVLDNCMGSGTTAIASMRTGRNYIGFELDEEYYKVAQQRIIDEGTHLESQPH